jgi:signal peptidase I
MHPQEAGATEVLANLSIATVVGIACVLTVLRIVFLNPAKLFAVGRPVDVGATSRGFAEILESLIIAGVLVFLVIRPFFLQAFFIPSQSMEPTLLGHDAGPGPGGETYNDTVHDHIFVNKLVYRYSKPQPGDVIVFRAPAHADIEHRDNPQAQIENILIKRLIAVPGDKIAVREDGVYRNGKKLNEPVFKSGDAQSATYFIKEKMSLSRTAMADYAQNEELTLEPNQYFVMGDNRNNSNDSRFWGPLDGDRIIGKAMFIFLPLNRIGGIR